MPGNKEGGLKTRDKNLANDPDYYKKLGKLGGAISHNGGFGSQKIGEDGLTGRERALIAGAKGGRISRRRKDEQKRT